MAQQVKKCVSIELIDGNGNFNTNGMKKFGKEVKLAERGRSYGVVSIMGPQNSGKSTLLNHLFDTDFKEMNALLGSSRTTQGVCLAHTLLTESCLLVVDTEGFDGEDRKDNTTFERQTALFALAISEIVMINMWHHDIGRRNAASWPLLTVVFEVMLRILMPRKVHLIFVLRDRIETPLEILKPQLIKQLEVLWNELPKPPAELNTALRDRFEIEVVLLSSCKYQKKEFEEEVATLRERVVCSLASSELTTNRTDASAVTLHTKMTWDQIKENKDLDLPSQKVLVAEIRCNQIFQEKCQNFFDDLSWIEVKKNVDSGAVVQGFGKIVSSLIDTYLFKYDTETQYFDEAVRAAKRKLLNEEILQVVEPIYLSVVEQMRNAILEKFKEAAGEELKSSGELVTTPSKFIDELHNQLKDVAIKQAKWYHPTAQLTQLESEITNCSKWIRDMNECLDQKKKRQEFWVEIAKIGSNLASTCAYAGAIMTNPSPQTLKNLEAITKILKKKK